MSTWKQAEIYELKHPKVSGKLTQTEKGRWQVEIWGAGNHRLFAGINASSAKAAQAEAEREIERYRAMFHGSERAKR